MNTVISMHENEQMTIGETVKQYGRQLFSFIKGKTRTAQDAEDILQEVWYQLSRVSNLDELENISAWLYFVSKNKITDLYRKNRTSSLEDFTFENKDGEFEIKDILLLDESQNPELMGLKELFWEELIVALDELPESQKLVFIENEMEDKTLQQIADEQGENLKTIISRKGYATKHLRKRLQHIYKDILNQ